MFLTSTRSATAAACFIAVGLSIVMGNGAARADEEPFPPPKHRLVYDNLILIRYNSLGAEDRPSMHYRLRLYNKTGPMWNDAHFGVGVEPTVNFAQTRLGPTITFKPIAFLAFVAGYYYNIWHGAFGNLRSYDSPIEDYFTEDDFDEVPDAYSGSGHELELGASVMFAAGPFVFSNQSKFYWTSMSLHDGDRWYFQPRMDLLVQNEGWFLADNADVGFITPFGLNVLARTAIFHAFYTDVDGATKQLNTPSVLFGPMLTYQFFDRAQASYNKPTLILYTAWWLRNRYRTGAQVNGGMPLVLLAFKFEGDIWWRD